MKRAATLAALMLVLLAAGAWYGWNSYQSFLARPLNLPADGLVLDVPTGMSGKGVIHRLSELGASVEGWQWRVLLKTEPFLLQAGEYRLMPGLTPRGLLGQLARGEVIRYRFTIIEGWTWRQLLAALKSDPLLGPGMPELSDEDWLLSAGSGLESPEGAFLPETYLFTRNETALDVLRRAAAALDEALARAWASRTPGHPAATPYELLILASIIEKETAIAEERPQISGVFVRRLNRGMRLQTDPTVIYGLGKNFDGDIRRRDLQTDTPYNTYTRHGLPPTPISMPGRASLMAAAQPADGDALYFVADGKGGHVFSRTLEEHQRGVDRLTGKN